MSRFEWAGFKRPKIWSSDELRELTDSEHGLRGDVVGVSVMTGSDGLMLYGPREQAIEWAERLLARLWAGEGRPVVDGEVVDMALDRSVAEIQGALRAVIEP